MGEVVAPISQTRRRAERSVPQRNNCRTIQLIGSGAELPAHGTGVVDLTAGTVASQQSSLISSHILQVAGYELGDHHTFSEEDILDWLIVHPDGTEEGNVVGKFLDTHGGGQ